VAQREAQLHASQKRAERAGEGLHTIHAEPMVASNNNSHGEVRDPSQGTPPRRHSARGANPDCHWHQVAAPHARGGDSLY
jgi:hypothetical protein